MIIMILDWVLNLFVVLTTLCVARSLALAGKKTGIFYYRVESFLWASFGVLSLFLSLAPHSWDDDIKLLAKLALTAVAYMACHRIRSVYMLN